jgi:hypothetical protein
VGTAHSAEKILCKNLWRGLLTALRKSCARIYGGVIGWLRVDVAYFAKISHADLLNAINLKPKRIIVFL